MRKKIKEETVDKIAKKHEDKIIEKSAMASGNYLFFEHTKNAIEQFLRDEEVEFSGVWHKAAGMRDVRRHGCEQDLVSLEILLGVRVLKYVDACIDLGEKLDSDERALYDQLKAMFACEIFVNKANEFIFLQMPVRHEIKVVDGSMSLSCDSGPAIEFSDGSKMYAKDDVFELPEWIIETPVDEMDPSKVIGIENIEHRAIAINKIGVTKLLDGATTIHEESYRTLYDMEHMLGRKALYLSMVNQSTGETHLEGVSNNSLTVQDARNSRAEPNAPCDLLEDAWKPLYIDGHVQESGNPSQRQHGDVCLQIRDDAPYGIDLLRQTVLLNKGSRHAISGGKLYGNERQQIFVTCGTRTITHPEHDTDTVDGIFDIWRISEHDHTKNILRDLLD